MSAQIEIGIGQAGEPVKIDMEELLATRLLVQGNSGSGKSHLLRRLLEESAKLVQQIVIDPEGDFVSLADEYGHIVVDGASYSVREIEVLAGRIRAHRASVVLALEGLEVEQQIRCAAQFLNALFDAPREHWYPALVVVDEAQMFAPAAAGEMNEETRRLTLSAMTNLMCRGRKRGLAGIVATQRLAKLAKNVAAEASNFLMGRTFLDIDMQRAADLLGMERKQAERIRDLERGQFLGLGPAITRRPVAVKIGPVRTGNKSAVKGLMPLPSGPSDEMEALLNAELKSEAVLPSPAPESAAPPAMEDVAEQIADFTLPEPENAEEEAPQINLFDETDHIIAGIMADMAADKNAHYQPVATLYNDFSTRCRIKKMLTAPLDMTQFRRRFAIATARLADLPESQRKMLLALAEPVAEDILAPFLAIGRAALQGCAGPDDEELARLYGTSSQGRIKRLLEHLEKTGLIVVRNDYGGGRTIYVPGLEPGS